LNRRLQQEIQIQLSKKLIAYSFLIVYLFPNYLDIPPHRHPRVSITEVSLDMLLVGLWIASSTVLLKFGKCTSKPSYLQACPEWIPSMTVGYFATLMFFMSSILGIKDLTDQANTDAPFQTKDHVMFARGSWKE
jgi:hypothetical protein